MRRVVDAPSSESEQMTLLSGGRKEVLNVEKTVLFDETVLRSAKFGAGKGYPVISITFSDDGRKRFAEWTRQNIGNRLAIIIAGQAYSAPRVMAEIPGGKTEISGGFSEQEAKDLVAKIEKAMKKR